MADLPTAIERELAVIRGRKCGDRTARHRAAQRMPPMADLLAELLRALAGMPADRRAVAIAAVLDRLR